MPMMPNDHAVSRVIFAPFAIFASFAVS